MCQNAFERRTGCLRVCGPGGQFEAQFLSLPFASGEDGHELVTVRRSYPGGEVHDAHILHKGDEFGCLAVGDHGLGDLLHKMCLR